MLSNWARIILRLNFLIALKLKLGTQHILHYFVDARGLFGAKQRFTRFGGFLFTFEDQTLTFKHKFLVFVRVEHLLAYVCFPNYC